MATIGDYDMAIITSGKLYFMLSCRLTPRDALSMQYRRRASTGGTEGLCGPHLHQEWASRCFGPKLLVGFWREDACHVGSPDLNSNRDRT
jgi:hypothetical protein